MAVCEVLSTGRGERATCRLARGNGGRSCLCGGGLGLAASAAKTTLFSEHLPTVIRDDTLVSGDDGRTDRQRAARPAPSRHIDLRFSSRSFVLAQSSTYLLTRLSARSLCAPPARTILLHLDRSRAASAARHSVIGYLAAQSSRISSIHFVFGGRRSTVLAQTGHILRFPPRLPTSCSPSRRSSPVCNCITLDC